MKEFIVTFSDSIDNPIEDQLNRQGYTLGHHAAYIQQLVRFSRMMRIHDILTDEEACQVNKRLRAKIGEVIKPFADAAALPADALPLLTTTATTTTESDNAR